MSGIPGTLIPAEWFNCSASQCKGRSHNDCVGLPGVTQDQLPFPWYCLVHLGMGRPPVQDEGVAGDGPSSVQREATVSESVANDSGGQEAGSRLTPIATRAAGRGGTARGRGAETGAAAGRKPGRPKGSVARGSRGK